MKLKNYSYIKNLKVTLKKISTLASFLGILVWMGFIATGFTQNKKPLRVIPLVPSIHEILYELGLGKYVVATNTYSQYPDSSLNVPKVGGLYDVNLEAILRFHPNIVFTDGSQIFRQREKLLKNAGIEIVELPTQSLEDIFTNIAKIGEIFGCQDKSRFLIHRIRDSLKFYSSGIKELIGNSGNRILLVIGRNPGNLTGIYVAGKKTFLSELFEMAGLQNVAEKEGYYQINFEKLMRHPVDVIIEFRAGASAELSQKMAKDWDKIRLSDKKKIKIIELNGNYVAIPGPRIHLILKEFMQKWEKN